MYFGFITTLYCFSITVSECSATYQSPLLNSPLLYQGSSQCSRLHDPSLGGSIVRFWSDPRDPTHSPGKEFRWEVVRATEDPEDKENILDSPHAKRFRFEEDMSATGDGDHLCWSEREMHLHWLAFLVFLLAPTQHQQPCFCPNAVSTSFGQQDDFLFYPI